ncbi:TonB-dependent receptor [Novosphingobium album (ex Hu et al. 2023)]|uniref:TonB-dependent receptor n=1 Tax=Novosphingobium album (ex Hu et al. 2023) TaxID=2930093 RepID=A0ABT0B7J6_9SPHN|nr:TonB-dependent receptor [Novosphingobium album (ex Hu et al. 2023)]MCJ2181009.1 TonB-dependent receptor [Novosphingobium album (ex Hu et al. 2023)]
MKKAVFSLFCSTAIAACAAPAFAQAPDKAKSAEQAAGSNYGEIIVTARKRDETLQSVPVAVTAIGGDALRTHLASDLTKVAEMAPQVAIGEGGSGTGAVISIRGISSSSSDAGFDQSVLVEVDGVPFSRGSIVGTRLFDTQSVQVLAGPQALYFGKNSPAGVISIRSADPTPSFEGYLTAGYEFTADQAYAEGAISGPLSDTLSARLAFRGSTQKGWTRNVAPVIPDVFAPAALQPLNTTGALPKRMPASDEIAGRITLLWEPSDDFKANLKFTVNSINVNTGNGNTEPYCIGATKAANAPVLLGFLPLPGSDCYADRKTSHAGVPAVYAKNIPYANGGKPYSDRMFYFGVLDMTKTFDDLSLTSTTGYYNEDLKLMNVTDWSPYATIWAAARYRYELLSQELRLTSDFDGPLNFMIGGYFEHSKRPFENAPDIFHVYNAAADNYASVVMRSVSKEDYISAFAELTWKILPDLELSGGARWSHDKKKMDQVNTAVGPNFSYLRAVGNHFLAGYSDNHVSPEATLTWHPSPDNTLYVAYKTGYKSGGISNPFLLAATTTPESITFQPEVSKGFEAGYKATLDGGRLRFDIIAYTYKYGDLQVVSADNSTPVITFNVRNAASSRVKGVQASFNWEAAKGLQLHGNLGLNSAKYTSFPNAQCFAFQTAAQGCVDVDPDPAKVFNAQDLSGKRMIRAPKLTYSFGGDYTAYDVLPGWNATLSASGSYSSSYQTTTDNAPGGVQKAYWLLDASLKVGPSDGSYELALIGRNLTNSYYKLQAYAWTASGNPDQYVAFWNRPREVVLQGTVRF